MRPARDEDCESVWRIHMAPEVLPYLGHDAMSVEAFAPLFASWVAGGDFFIFEREGAVAGFYRIARGSGRASHVAQLRTLAVDPALRGSGVAKEMVEGALARMRDAGIVRVELQVEADNARGRAFYRKMGFEEEGVQRRAYLREGVEVDEIMMVRFLD